MRTGCYINKREVVAIVLEDIASVVTYPCEAIKKTIDSQGVECTKNTSADFLHPNGKMIKYQDDFPMAADQT